MSSEKKRKKVEAKEKLAILKEHLVNGEKISTICEKYNINPNQFYRWQSELLSNESAFSPHFKDLLNLTICKENTHSYQGLLSCSR